MGAAEFSNENGKFLSVESAAQGTRYSVDGDPQPLGEARSSAASSSTITSFGAFRRSTPS